MKTKNYFAGIFASMILFISACSSPAPAPVPEAIDMDAVKTEIQAMEDAYAAAEKMKDAAGVAAYYSADAISYTRNREPMVGKEAIKNGIAERIAKDTTGNTNVYKVVDLFIDGNIAVEIGSWQEMDSTGQEVDRGHYMSYFSKHDGKYLCDRDMSVSAMPEKK